MQELKRSGVVGGGALLIVDEFDQIPDKSGFASLIKALPDDLGRFVLVGVGDDVSQLVSEHASIPRQIGEGCIQVGLMTPKELEDIVDRAEKFLRNSYRFLPEARKKIVDLARGTPYFVHLIGKYSLMQARKNNVIEVDNVCVEKAIEEIALRGSAIYEPQYIKSIGRSYIQEFVLKTFSQREEDEIYTTDVYDLIAKEMNIDPAAVSVYVGRLGAEERGSVITKVRDRCYRFSDNLFRTYAALRPFQLKPNNRETE